MKYSKQILNDFFVLHWRSLLVLLVSTGLMLFQHSQGWNWDLNVYSMNGEYLFHSGSYIEWQRPIVVPTILGLLQFFFNRGVSEYLFVALSNIFFYWAAFRSSKSFNLGFEKFYILLMSPMAIFIGNFHGSEMLSLSLVMLFFSEIYRSSSGLWMSLAFLTRNTNFIVIPFALIDSDWKRVIRKFGIAAVPVSIWLIFNWTLLGDPFSPIANRIAINFYENPFNFPIKPLSFLKVSGLSSVIITAYLIREKPSLSLERLEKIDLMLLAFSSYIIAKYLLVDLRQTRFLYPLVFTSAFFAVKAFDNLDLDFKWMNIFMILNLVSAGFLVIDTPVSKSDGFKRASDYIDGCRAESDVWPQMAYAGAPATKPLEPNLTEYRISNGWRAVFFNPDRYFENTSIRANLPIIEENPSYVVYGNESCLESSVVNETYLQKKKKLDQLHGEVGVYQPTYYIMEKFGLNGRKLMESSFFGKLLS